MRVRHRTHCTEQPTIAKKALFNIVRALWFGTEVSGLSEAAMRYCQKHIYVPMYGMVESLNLSVCVGIVAGEVVRQRLAFVRTGDGNSLRTTSLSADDQAAWVARMSTRVAKRQRTGRLRVDAGE